MSLSNIPQITPNIRAYPDEAYEYTIREFNQGIKNRLGLAEAISIEDFRGIYLSLLRTQANIRLSDSALDDNSGQIIKFPEVSTVFNAALALIIERMEELKFPEDQIRSVLSTKYIVGRDTIKTYEV